MAASSEAFAKWDYKTEAFLSARARHFNSAATPSLAEDNTDQFLYLREEFAYSSEKWRMVASPFVMVENSQVSQGSDPILTPIFSRRRQLGLETQLKGDPHTVSTLDFQELFAGWADDKYKIEAGRRILSLGNLKILPGWNKFNPTATSFRPTWLSGVDQVNFSLQTETAKVIAYSVFDQDRIDQAQLFEMDFVNESLQWSLLAGQWWSANTAGLSVTYDISGYLLKFEALAFEYYGVKESFGHQNQWGAGIERSFAQDWAVNLEFLVQSHGAKKTEDYANHVRTPHESLRGYGYAAGELKWTPDSFHTLSLVSLLSLVDQSSLQGLTVARQLNENMELSLGIFIPQGNNGEFSPDARILSLTNAEAFTGAPSQVDLTLKLFF